MGDFLKHSTSGTHRWVIISNLILTIQRNIRAIFHKVDHADLA